MKRPTALRVNVDGIPDALKRERRWVIWRYEWQQHDGKKGRWTKILCTSAGRHAKSNDPSTWTTFDDALSAYHTGGFDGVGFCLGDGWAGIDLDNCRQNGVYVAPGPVARLTCYVEVSPSDTGAKAIGRAVRIGGEVNCVSGVFTTWSGPRFFTITGHGAGDPTVDISSLIDEWFPTRSQFVSPSALRPSFVVEGDIRGTEQIGASDVYAKLTDDQVVERIVATPQAEKFIKLVRGDVSDYGDDHSRADQALCSMLAYWCQGDIDQIDRLFRQSGLMRDKWNASSYRRATLAKAVQS